MIFASLLVPKSCAAAIRETPKLYWHRFPCVEEHRQRSREDYRAVGAESLFAAGHVKSSDRSPKKSRRKRPYIEQLPSTFSGVKNLTKECCFEPFNERCHKKLIHYIFVVFMVI